jgi:LPPG:FO 2-phospho-L-lactate transferase
MKQKFADLRVVALAGGVGGAKMAYGLSQVLRPQNLTILVNVGDDFEHYGLRICPDLDTVCYTLAGLANPVTGWGVVDESWTAMRAAAILGGPTWFQLGDRDLGTHLERTRKLRSGQTLSEITQDFCKAWKIQVRVLPITNSIVPTIVHIEEVDLTFQEYFVQRRCEPKIKNFTFVNADVSTPAPGVLDALKEAQLILICPSNPFVSIDPILAIPGVLQTIQEQRMGGGVIIAVTPIIGGKTVKGPAAKMFLELGIQPSAFAVAEHYQGIITGLIVDEKDRCQESVIRELGIQTKITDTLIPNPIEQQRLAHEALTFYQEIFHSA